MMDMFICNADVYCGACGRAVRRRIKAAGQAPADPRDESTYDSGEYPKGPYDSDDQTADVPDHCGSGPKCLEPLVLSDGTKVGKFLENPLTTEGERYVREANTESHSEVTQMWMDHYGLKGEEDDDES